MASALHRSTRSLSFTLLVCLALLTTACGVSFGESFEGTEMFKGLSLMGERSPGSELTLTVTVVQPYPVPVHIACFYEDSNDLSDDEYRVAYHERAQRIGSAMLPVGDGSKRREPISFKFVAPVTGDYFLACLTPAAAENGLGLSFSIRNGGASSRAD
jgi:hypothetical protein